MNNQKVNSEEVGIKWKVLDYLPVICCFNLMSVSVIHCFGFDWHQIKWNPSETQVAVMVWKTDVKMYQLPGLNYSYLIGNNLQWQLILHFISLHSLSLNTC